MEFDNTNLDHTKTRARMRRLTKGNPASKHTGRNYKYYLKGRKAQERRKTTVNS